MGAENLFERFARQEAEGNVLLVPEVERLLAEWWALRDRLADAEAGGAEAETLQVQFDAVSRALKSKPWAERAK